VRHLVRRAGRGVYRLGREAFTPLVGLVAAALVVSRFDFPFYAARGYIDIAYMAIVVWAAGRRGARAAPAPVLVLACSASPGCCAPRPGSWRPVLAVGRLAGPARPAARALFAVLAAIGPFVWAATDFLVTGNPLYSLTYTSGFAEELGRAKGAEGVPAAIWAFLIKLTKFPVLIGGIAGLGVAAVLVPRRVVMPLVLLVVGIGTFGLVGAGGFSVIDRYLLVTSMMVMIFCAVALGGWTMLREGTFLRRAWAIAAALLVVYGVAFTATRVNVDRLDNELVFRGDAHAALHDVLNDPAVRAGLRCGPVNVPNHKLIPDIRWISDLPDREVLARSETAYDGPDRARRRAAERTGRRIAAGGVSIIPHQRAALFRQALVEETDDPATVLPLPGYERRAVSNYYAAYVRCP
jgi:hypothetical protein